MQYVDSIPKGGEKACECVWGGFHDWLCFQLYRTVQYTLAVATIAAAFAVIV
jgi:hypothetical protein